MRSNSPEHAATPPHCSKHDRYLSPEETKTVGCFKCRSEVLEEAADRVGARAGEAAAVATDGGEPPRDLKLRIQRLVGLPNLDAPAALEILDVCVDLAEFLMEKNKAYGDSALKPVRILSRADPAEQIRIRMDDKLSRLVRGEMGGEDAMQDLVGYWVLMRVAERRKENADGPA